MPIENPTDTLDIAELPLADGRKLALPLLALAEVQQIRPSANDLGTLRWRGHNLKVHSLEAFLGLKQPPVEAHTTVAIFRAAKSADEPFRALAFCGLAAHRCIQPGDMTPVELPDKGLFSAAAKMDGNTYLVPNLPELIFQPDHGELH
jgi:hypothetical protein